MRLICLTEEDSVCVWVWVLWISLDWYCRCCYRACCHCHCRLLLLPAVWVSLFPFEAFLLKLLALCEYVCVREYVCARNAYVFGLSRHNQFSGAKSQHRNLDSKQSMYKYGRTLYHSNHTILSSWRNTSLGFSPEISTTSQFYLNSLSKLVQLESALRFEQQ